MIFNFSTKTNFESVAFRFCVFETYSDCGVGKLFWAVSGSRRFMVMSNLFVVPCQLGMWVLFFKIVVRQVLFYLSDIATDTGRNTRGTFCSEYGYML